jgi:enoyl-CoA hydratase
MHVEFATSGSVATIRLNRPEKQNALTSEMISSLSELLTNVERSRDLRALILTAEGNEAFCGGVDSREQSQVICQRLETLPIPVIAAINGIAAGGGCELALACHLRIAAKSAEFVSLAGETISADQAKKSGLVNSVVDDERLMKAAAALAKQIASMAPLAIRAGLKAVNEGGEMSLEDGLDLEARLFASLFSTEDVKEGTRAFLEKRQPHFKGH